MSEQVKMLSLSLYGPIVILLLNLLFYFFSLSQTINCSCNFKWDLDV